MIAVLGPGGVGGFLAGALARAGSAVEVVAREPTAEALRERGLRVESVRLGDFETRPNVATSLTEPARLLIVATKAYSLTAALDRVEAEPRFVLPLLNGLDHLPLLRERFPGRVAAAAIRIEADRVAPGLVRHTSPFLRIDVSAERAQPVGLEALERAGVPVRTVRADADALWGKLVRLNALALTTSAWDVPLGEIRADPGRRELLARAVAEGAAVARAEGAEIEPAAVLDELEAAHASLGSSMRRDMAAGRPTELDAIAGGVLRAAERHAIECPAIAELAGRVRARSDNSSPC